MVLFGDFPRAGVNAQQVEAGLGEGRDDLVHLEQEMGKQEAGSTTGQRSHHRPVYTIALYIFSFWAFIGFLDYSTIVLLD